MGSSPIDDIRNTTIGMSTCVSVYVTLPTQNDDFLEDEWARIGREAVFGWEAVQSVHNCLHILWPHLLGGIKPKLS